MPSVRKDREAAVATLTKDLEGVQGLVVAGYDGVKTPELNELREKLRAQKGECRIVKNTLAKIALKNRGVEKFQDYFDGQSALVIYRGDAAATTKVLVDFEKAHENWKIRAGYLDGQVMPLKDLRVFAALPSKPVLLAKLLGALQAPLSRFQGVMQAPLRYLVNSLDQVAKKKEAAGGSQPSATAS